MSLSNKNVWAARPALHQTGATAPNVQKICWKTMFVTHFLEHMSQKFYEQFIVIYIIDVTEVPSRYPKVFFNLFYLIFFLKDVRPINLFIFTLYLEIGETIRRTYFSRIAFNFCKLNLHFINVNCCQRQKFSNWIFVGNLHKLNETFL